MFEQAQVSKYFGHQQEECGTLIPRLLDNFSLWWNIGEEEKSIGQNNLFREFSIFFKSPPR